MFNSFSLLLTIVIVSAGKKRPAWDTKGRLEDMEVAMSRHLEQNTNLQQQILQSNDRIAMLESLNCQLKGTVQQSEQMTSQANDEIMSLRRRLRYNSAMDLLVLCIMSN
jgi:small-conductance mechanosensitive channel